MEPLAALERAAAEYERRLVAVTPDQWDRPSVCERWSVKDLADHVVGGNRLAVALLAGASVEDAFTAALEGGFDGDPLALFRDSAAAQQAAFAEPGASERVVHHPAGEIPGAVFLGFRLGDLVVHAWDLARSTGGDERLDDDLVAAVWAAYEARAAAMPATGMFGEGPSGTVAHDAPLQQRLLDLTGRRP